MLVASGGTGFEIDLRLSSLTMRVSARGWSELIARTNTTPGWCHWSRHLTSWTKPSAGTSEYHGQATRRTPPSRGKPPPDLAGWGPSVRTEVTDVDCVFAARVDQSWGEAPAGQTTKWWGSGSSGRSVGDTARVVVTVSPATNIYLYIERGVER